MACVDRGVCVANSLWAPHAFWSPLSHGLLPASPKYSSLSSGFLRKSCPLTALLRAGAEDETWLVLVLLAQPEQQGCWRGRNAKKKKVDSGLYTFHLAVVAVWHQIRGSSSFGEMLLGCWL